MSATTTTVSESAAGDFQRLETLLESICELLTPPNGIDTTEPDEEAIQATYWTASTARAFVRAAHEAESKRDEERYRNGRPQSVDFLAGRIARLERDLAEAEARLAAAEKPKQASANKVTRRPSTARKAARK